MSRSILWIDRLGYVNLDAIPVICPIIYGESKIEAYQLCGIGKDAYIDETYIVKKGTPAYGAIKAYIANNLLIMPKAKGVES